MTDPVKLHAAHTSISGMAEKWAQKAVQHKEKGEMGEYKIAVRMATDWLKLARELERLTERDSP